MPDRGDSVATMVDLEAASGAAGGPTGASRAEEAAVPVHHVRRLTSTLVDILRHISGGQQQQQQGGGSGGSKGGAVPEITPGAHHERSESAALLLGDGASEASFPSDDKLSMASSSGNASTTSGSEITSSRAALLGAAFYRGEEYKGDEVKPFYLDCPGGARGPALASEDPSSPSKAMAETAAAEDLDSGAEQERMLACLALRSPPA